ncbi:hypothetical protein GCM10015535_38450 [Streptomyces gelaticus]|uniref:Uncharacterized protein n=1 Tax=Streptomyces gelaticus TaxID=285446 RepID=A0ABQ2W0Y7_9ACTN|nr:hypothetical protein [Streptomyces gelaticus]GGV88041.1 hypothetical protein GCM10015535_38450 [Streptomyces gelaticus]
MKLKAINEKIQKTVVMTLAGAAIFATVQTVSEAGREDRGSSYATASALLDDPWHPSPVTAAALLDDPWHPSPVTAAALLDDPWHPSPAAATIPLDDPWHPALSA